MASARACDVHESSWQSFLFFALGTCLLGIVNGLDLNEGLLAWLFSAVRVLGAGSMSCPMATSVLRLVADWLGRHEVCCLRGRNGLVARLSRDGRQAGGVADGPVRVSALNACARRYIV